MSLNILKKISVATLSGLSPKQLAALVPTPESAPAFVGRIAGSVRKFEVGQSTYGDFLKFSGEFRGWNMAGEMSASTVAFLPSPVDEMLKNAVEDARGEDGTGKASIDFAFDIVVVHDPKEGSKGYQYRVQTLTEAKVSDPVAALIGALPSLPKASAAIGQEKQAAEKPSKGK